MDYLVTGGAGFIGSNIAEHLVGLGRRVRIFDNFSSGKRANVRAFADKVEIVEGDLRDPKAVAHAVNGVRFALHLGAMPSVIRSPMISCGITASTSSISRTRRSSSAAWAAVETQPLSHTQRRWPSTHTDVSSKLPAAWTRSGAWVT